MKTTIDIADALLRKAHTMAAKRGTTLRALVEAGLRHELREKPPKPANFTDARYGRGGLTPAAERAAGGPGWERIRRLAYEDWTEQDEAE
jgi:hypothetical protein